MLRVAADRTVINFPVPVLRPDAHCWAATIWPDPAQSGGWDRALWWDWALSRPGYRPIALEYSDIREFGADLPVGTGRDAFLFPIRWYGMMLSRSRWELIAHVELAPPGSSRPAPPGRLYFQEPAYRHHDDERYTRWTRAKDESRSESVTPGHETGRMARSWYFDGGECPRAE